MADNKLQRANPKTRKNMNLPAKQAQAFNIRLVLFWQNACSKYWLT